MQHSVPFSKLLVKLNSLTVLTGQKLPLEFHTTKLLFIDVADLIADFM